MGSPHQRGTDDCPAYAGPRPALAALPAEVDSGLRSAVNESLHAKPEFAFVYHGGQRQFRRLSQNLSAKQSHTTAGNGPLTSCPSFTAAASANRASAGNDLVPVFVMMAARWFSTVRWLIPRSA